MNGAYSYIKNHQLKIKTPVIIAVLDTDIDVNHEAFTHFVWLNPKEIFNNGIDDDGNGYIDDKNGWNFIAKKSDGASLDFTLIEETRILRTYSKKKLDRLHKREKVLFNYNKVKESYDDIYESLKEEIKPYAEQEADYTKIYNVLKETFKKENITLEDLENFETSDDYIKQCITFIKHYYDTGYPYDEFIESLKYKQNCLDICMNLDYDNRKLIGDELHNFKDKNYGSPNVAGKVNSINHGTEVTGVVTNGLKTFTNNKIDVFRIMPLVITGIGDPTDKDTALAIRYAVDNGAKVINLSQTKSFSINDKFVDDALFYAEEHDVLIVKSAGNETLDLDVNTRYPNDTNNKNETIFDNMIVVGASTENIDSLIRYSTNYGGGNVDVFAPSTNIATLIPNNGYLVDSGGTSYSAPVVTALAALIRAYFPNLTASQVKLILMNSGTSYKLDMTIEKDDGTKITKPFSSLSKSGKVVNAYNALIMADSISRKW